jgi:hypothetical protein
MAMQVPTRLRRFIDVPPPRVDRSRESITPTISTSWTGGNRGLD